MGTSYPITGTYNGTGLPPGALPSGAGATLAFLGSFMIVIIVIALLFYIYSAICYMKIARKTGTGNAWMAWIPILNIILMLKVAQKPLWWIILFFIPLVNIIVSILVWMAISENVGKPNWLGILMIIPVVNLVILGYWAFSSGNNAAPAAPQPPVAPAPPVPPAAPNPPTSPTSGPFV